MTYGTEGLRTRREADLVLQNDDLDATLTEISVAALTTEPELRDHARSLVLLARYHTQRECHRRSLVVPRSAGTYPRYAG